MAANDGISEANQWSSQYFGGLAEQWNQEFDVAESLRAEQQMIARMEEQERIANAVLPPGRGGLPPGKGGDEPPEKKKKHPQPPPIPPLPPILPVPPIPPIPPWPPEPPEPEPEPEPEPPEPEPEPEKPKEPIEEQPPDLSPLKQWNNEPGACPTCMDNAAAGPIPQDQAFPSGDMEPPAHDHCRCWIEYVYQFPHGKPVKFDLPPWAQPESYNASSLS